MNFYGGYNPNPGSYAPALPLAKAEEAKGAQVPFDGRPYAFIDPTGDRVYVKQFDPATGSTRFELYARQEPAPPPRYVTFADLEEFKRELMKGGGESV